MTTKPEKKMKKVRIYFDVLSLVVWAPMEMTEEQIEAAAPHDFHTLDDLNLFVEVSATTIENLPGAVHVDDTVLTLDGEFVNIEDYEFEPVLKTEQEELESAGQLQLPATNQPVPK